MKKTILTMAMLSAFSTATLAEDIPLDLLKQQYDTKESKKISEIAKQQFPKAPMIVKEVFEYPYIDDSRLGRIDDVLAMIEEKGIESLEKQGFKPLTITAEKFVTNIELYQGFFKQKGLLVVVDRFGNYLHSDGRKWHGLVHVGFENLGIASYLFYEGASTRTKQTIENIILRNKHIIFDFKEEYNLIIPLMYLESKKISNYHGEEHKRGAAKRIFKNLNIQKIDKEKKRYILFSQFRSGEFQIGIFDENYKILKKYSQSMDFRDNFFEKSFLDEYFASFFTNYEVASINGYEFTQRYKFSRYADTYYNDAIKNKSSSFLSGFIESLGLKYVIENIERDFIDQIPPLLLESIFKEQNPK